MRSVLAILMALAFSSASAANAYFGIYGITQSSSVQSCSGDCPVSLRDRAIPFGLTVGAYLPGRVQFGAEIMLGDQSAVIAKGRYVTGPWGFEIGVGKQSQYVEIKNQTVGAQPLYDKSRGVGNVYLVGVSYRHFVLSYLQSDATHDASGFIAATPTNIPLVAHTKVRSRYVRLEYRFDF